MDREKKAGELFLEGRNCSQAVFAAFCDATGYSESDALKLASAFGGGIGGSRETCGAVSAMAMIAGVIAGYDSANDMEEKKKLYALVNGMLEEFREKNGSTVCRELLKGIKTSPVPSERTEEYYRTRPCVRFVESAARIVSKTFEI